MAKPTSSVLTIPYESATAEQKLRACWAAFCDADPVPTEFIEDMEAAGLVELQLLNKREAKAVMAEDGFWEAKYGDHQPTSIFVLTDAGRAALAQLQENDDE